MARARTDRPAFFRALAAALALLPAARASAQTTPCEAVFEPVLAGGISEAMTRIRLNWRILGDDYVAAYTLEGEKANPFDIAKRREGPPELAPGRPAEVIAGIAAARGVRCNVSAMSAMERVRLVLVAAGLRFKEGRGGWSAIVPNGIIAEYELRRTPRGWSVADLSADRAVLPPDARLTPPPEGLAHAVAALPWRAARRDRRRR